MVLDTLHTEHLELASGVGDDGGELGCSIGAGSVSLLLAADTGGWWGWLVFRFIFLQKGGEVRQRWSEGVYKCS